jgi:hypothetical protein
MTDLISLSDYKEYKGINSATRDGKFQAIITYASALVESYCARTFIDYASTPGVTEWFDSHQEIVYLKHFPLIQVNSVDTSIDGGITQVAMVQDDPDSAGFFVDLENGAVRTQKTGDKFLEKSYYNTPYRSLEINYNAGYADKDALPADLRLAILDIISYIESNEDKPTQNLLGATLDNPLPYVANSFPAHIRRVLDLYRYIPG